MYFGKVKKQDHDRVPPNQNVTTSFPVLHHGNIPYYQDLSKWTLRVFGEVEKECLFSYKDIMEWTQTEAQNDIHCVTGWTKLDNEWEGIPTNELHQYVRINPEAKFVILHAEEDWSTNLPIDDFMKQGSLLAHSHNGKPLNPEHGFPLRAVIPHLYFWKSAKWLRGIEFSRVNQPGFWEKNGYHMYGNPFKEQRYSWD